MSKVELLKQELSFHTRRDDIHQMSEKWWRNIILLVAEILIEMEESNVEVDSDD